MQRCIRHFECFGDSGKLCIKNVEQWEVNAIPSLILEILLPGKLMEIMNVGLNPSLNQKYGGNTK